MHLLSTKPVSDNIDETLRVLSARNGVTTSFRIGKETLRAQVQVDTDGTVVVQGAVDADEAVPHEMLAKNPHAAYFAHISPLEKSARERVHQSRQQSQQRYQIHALKRQQRRQSLRGAVGQAWRMQAQDDRGCAFRFVALDASLSGIGGHVCQPDNTAQTPQNITSVQLLSRQTGGASLRATQRRAWRGPLCPVCKSCQYIGLEVDGQSELDKVNYAEHVCRILFPNITLGATQSHAIWSVLDEAGYFDLSGKDAGIFAKKKHDYLKFNKQLSCAPMLGHQLAWQAGGHAVASIASCRAFTRAHLLHHLGKVSKKGQDKTSLRDILVCSVELTKHDEDVDYVCAYLNKAVPFHRQSAIPFATSFEKTGEAACLPLQLYELDAALVALRADTIGGYRVRVAQANERAHLIATLAQRFGTCFCEAFDRTDERLDWTVAGRQWQKVGLKRQREVLVAVSADGRAAAAAIVEMASSGSNLFHIFDAMTVTHLDETISEQSFTDAHTALATHSGRWFLQHGVRRFITPVFAAEKTLQAPLGAADLGSGALWIVGRRLFGRLQEYWHLQL